MKKVTDPIFLFKNLIILWFYKKFQSYRYPELFSDISYCFIEQVSVPSILLLSYCSFGFTKQVTGNCSYRFTKQFNQIIK